MNQLSVYLKNGIGFVNKKNGPPPFQFDRWFLMDGKPVQNGHRFSKSGRTDVMRLRSRAKEDALAADCALRAMSYGL
jgi:hypothetical protein